MLFDRFFYPEPPPMPPVVDEPVEDLLRRLEAVLHRNAPAVAERLQPGLGAEQLSGLEGRLGFRLSDELRALYQWRDGMVRGVRSDFIPGHRFLPLEEAVEQLLEFKRQLRSATLLQRTVYRLTAGYRRSWLTLLDDGSGDGYFFDPKRQRTGGAVFYHFAEDRDYRFFPSLRNLLAGVIQCFEEGVYSPAGEGLLREDFERSALLWERFGAADLRQSPG